MTTRPTSDRVKESLFNIIAPYVADSDILDLFAGTGSLGIEALSRGAHSAAFVDKSGECCKIIEENLIHTKLSDSGEVINSSFSTALTGFITQKRRFDIILLDPPYNKNFIQESLKILTNNDIISDKGILVAEHHVDDELPEHTDGLQLIDKRVYGETALSLYIRCGDTPQIPLRGMSRV